MKRLLFPTALFLVILTVPTIRADVDEDEPFYRGALESMKRRKVLDEMNRHFDDVIDSVRSRSGSGGLPSPLTPNLVGVWAVEGVDAAGVRWAGQIAYFPNQRVAAQLRGMTPGGAVGLRQWTGHFGYYANGTLAVVVDRPWQIQAHRIEWLHPHSFVLFSAGGRWAHQRVR